MVLLVSFVACAVLAPPIRIAMGLPTLRPEIFVVLLAVVSGQLKLGFGGRIPRLLIAFFVIAVVAIGASYTVFGIPFKGGDLSVFPMLVQYWLAYCFAKSFSDRQGRRLVVTAVAVCIGVTAMIGIWQKLNFLGINDWLTPYYIEKNDIGEFALESLRGGKPWARSVGTVGDPRHFGCMLAVGVGACLSLMLGKRARGGVLIFSVIVLALCQLGMIFCVSRTGFIAVFLQLAICAYLYVRKTGNMVVPLVGGITFVFLLVINWSRFATENESDRLLMGGEKMVESSGYARIRDFKEPFVKSLENPLILVTGMGPAKAVLPGSEHNDIGWVTLRYGLGGLFVYVSIFFWSAQRSLWFYQVTRSGDEGRAAMFFVLTLSVWCLYAMAESIFKLPQVMSINMLAVGMIFGFRGNAARRPKRVMKRSRRPRRVSAPEPGPAPQS